ncbi:hypothetical protein DEIPH_ctg040orf0044 [Deinococcus phoenicis]|uniref:Transposase n=1 Tax=Deinococcus phoenicis TaxID=1476583 RepID=A0A016QNM8_9DEIO|nr:hypothetical protein DEIPH_ctg040orf0044 [Deinococcus phoenicis]
MIACGGQLFLRMCDNVQQSIRSGTAINADEYSSYARLPE